MSNRYAYVWTWKTGLALLATLFTFPAFYPQFDRSVDGSCAWLYNYFWQNDRSALAQLVFPHGPLDFLQTPLPMGSNLGWALVFNAVLRFLFFWLGLHLAAQHGRRAQWVYGLVLVGLLRLNMMDVLLFGTVAHAVLWAQQAQGHWSRAGMGLAAALTVVGLLTKTIIGLPCAMLLGVVWCWNAWQTRQIMPLLGWSAALLLGWWLGWCATTGGTAGFGQMLLGTFWLSVGNSAAVCHYPANNWWALGLFWAAFLSWPFFSKHPKEWYWLLLPVFAFWKYGISREDIWHLDTTFRVVIVVFALLLLVQKRPLWSQWALAFVAVGSFWANLRHAEGWSPYTWQGTGWRNGLDWLLHFEEKRAHHLQAGLERMQRHVLPDSMRAVIGDRTVDIFPWHYAYALPNHLRLSPRHIPQSYAAYHPWLDRLDAAFFQSAQAPDFVLVHLKPSDAGNQWAGIDDRYLLHDAPATLLQLVDRYRVRMKTAQFWLLEKTAQHQVAAQPQPMAYTPDWPQQIPDTTGMVWLKAQLHKNWKGRLKSLLYKDDPVLLDLHFGAVVRRVKIVPALAETGLWLAPWLETANEGDVFRCPDRIEWILPDTWVLDTASLALEWRTVDARSGWIPAQRATWVPRLRHHLPPQPDAVPPAGFSQGWEYRLDSLGDGPFTLEVQAQIRATHNIGCCQLVLSAQDTTGKTVHYASTEYCPMGIGDGQPWPVGLRTQLPKALVPPVLLKVYVWNTATQALWVDGVRVVGGN